jgi:hypothetical protein
MSRPAHVLRFSTRAPKIVDATGFAVIGGTTVKVTGAPASFSSSDWVWGEPRKWASIII